MWWAVLLQPINLPPESWLRPERNHEMIVMMEVRKQNNLFFATRMERDDAETCKKVPQIGSMDVVVLRQFLLKLYALCSK